jgi:putative membrane protein
MRLLLRWLINAVSLLIVAHFVRGFEVRSLTAALLAALIIGLVNATLGTVLKILTFPLTILTLGLFLIVINALMLKLAAAITPGFVVRDWTAALLGAVLLAIMSGILNWLVGDKKNDD